MGGEVGGKGGCSNCVFIKIVWWLQGPERSADGPGKRRPARSSDARGDQGEDLYLWLHSCRGLGGRGVFLFHLGCGGGEWGVGVRSSQWAEPGDKRRGVRLMAGRFPMVRPEHDVPNELRPPRASNSRLWPAKSQRVAFVLLYSRSGHTHGPSLSLFGQCEMYFPVPLTDSSVSFGQ